MNAATPKRSSLLVAALSMPLALVISAANSVPRANQNQAVRQTSEDHMNIDQQAPAITRDKILIAAPLSTVWNVQTGVSRWPQWNTDVSSAAIDGPLAVGSVFR